MELHSHEAEQIVLGRIISGGILSPSHAKALSEASFYFDAHKLVWCSILELSEEGASLDVISISDILDKKKKLDIVGGSSYLVELVNKSFEAKNIDHHIVIINNKAELRYFWEFFSKQADDIKNGKTVNSSNIISDISNKLISFNPSGAEEHTSIADISRIYTRLQEKYAEKKSQGIDYLGIPTKYAALDRATDGYQPECLWTVAAFTSVGKTTYMINLIKKLLDQDKHVCVFSLEMSKEDLFSKLLALELDISAVEITKGLLNNEIYSKQVSAKKKYMEKNLTVYTECVAIEDILLTMKSENIKNKIDVFFLDYIQNLTSKKSLDQFKLLTFAVKEIQTLTRKLKTTTVLLSQISNESNKSGGVLEVGGKDAGAIRAASNVFIYLKRDGTEEDILEKYKTGMDIPMKLILNKNRMGRIGSFNLNLKQQSGVMYEPL